MTVLRRILPIAPLAAFSALAILPAIAIREGVLPFELRFEALLAASILSVVLCALVGISLSELGLRDPWVRRHWISCGALTAALCVSVALESRLVGSAADAPRWLVFLPFYVLVSSPCQEVACRAIPKLLTDRLELGGPAYVLYSATVFSLMHAAYDSPLLLLNTFVAGAAWAAAYLSTRNIWPLVVSHAAVGTFAFALGVA